jgi:indolepyruvate ferredoxin oxidoreductase, beta subunit
MKKLPTINILFCGIGGQGVLKAAEVCGLAAMRQGYHVKKTEVHGMAQRGGSVESHIRFGSHVWSALIPEGKADYLVSFYPDEYARLRSFLKKDGVAFMKELKQALGLVKDPRHINTFLLGALSMHLPLTQDSWMAALEIVFAGKGLEENKRIFLLGRKELK